MYWLVLALSLMQVSAVVQRADPSLTRVEILRQAQVNDTLDAAVISGSDKNRAGQKLGLLLQNRSNPALVYLLAIEPAPLGCYPKVERIAETYAAGSCGEEKFEQMPNWKFLFDPRAKALVRFLTYLPFSTSRIFLEKDGAVFLGSNTEKIIAVEYRPARDPAFRILGEGETRPWVAGVHISTGTVGLPPKEVVSIDPERRKAPDIPLRQTTYDEFAAARPERFKMGYVRAGTEVHDGIGPWTREGTGIWFAKNFYDGEGSTGVGAFGYFDTATRKYKLYSPPEIVDWSVSAMSVGSNDIWMGLVSNGEYGPASGGLLRFDRNTETVQRFPIKDVVLRIDRLEDRILVATGSGIAIVEGNQIRRYFVDRMSDGRWRVVEAY